MVNRGTVVGTRCLLVAAAITAVAAGLFAGPDRDPVEVLKHVIAKELEAGDRLPNYTCVETVNRAFFKTAAIALPRSCSVILEQRQHPTLDMALHLSSTDRLRLDVAMVNHGEIFSWAGASKFNDEGIDHVVSEGPMGTGAFGGFLLVVLKEDPTRFTFVRNLAVDGRNLMEYSFSVPVANSHYRVKVNDSWEPTAYSGTFQVDPETSDVVRMMVRTAELPPDTGTCIVTADMEYANVQIGSSRFPLPSHMRQRWVALNGGEAENTTTITACREYKGESTLMFLAEPEALPAGKVQTPPSSPAPLPPGQQFAFELTAPIPTDTAAGGDIFTGRLTEPIRVAKSKPLAPKGAIVEGRIIRVENFLRPPHAFVVLRPRSVEVKGIKVPLACLRDWERQITENRRLGKKKVEVFLPLQGEERSGVFRFEGEHVVVPKGFRSDWRTVSAVQAEAASQR